MARLVYHAGALGDFITTLPAIRAWRAHARPQRTILLGRPAFAGLAAPPFDEVWDVDSALFAPLFSSGPVADHRLRQLISPFEAALLFAAAASRLAENLSALGVRDVVRQEPFPEAPVPIVDYHLSLFGGRLAAGDSAVPEVAIDGEMPAFASGITAAVHAGSGSAAKNWPLERFVELSRILGERGESVAWIIGPAEESIPLPTGARAWRNEKLTALAAALSRCSLYVGNDSGITHLAAASGCPTVALFCAGDPLVWAPRGRVVRVMTASGERSVPSVGGVLEVCAELSGG